MRFDTDDSDKVWLTVCVLKVLERVEVRTLCTPIKFFHTKLVEFMELALCTGAVDTKHTT